MASLEASQRAQLDFTRRPLPLGWDAKWDPNNKRFFYINHTTRRTTWEDPRSPASSVFASQAPGALNKDPAQELKRRFPTAPEPIIQAVLVAGSKNVEEGAKRLREMGYGGTKAGQGESFEMSVRTGSSLGKKTTSPTKTSSFSSGAAKPTSSAGGKKATTAKKTTPGKKAEPKKDTSKKTTTGPTKKAPAKKAEPSEAEKKRVLAECRKKFPKVEEHTLTMILDACLYEKSTAMILLKEHEDKPSTVTSGRSSGATSYSSSPPVSSVPLDTTPAYEPAPLEPITLPELPDFHTFSASSIGSLLGDHSRMPAFGREGGSMLSSFFRKEKPSPLATRRPETRRKPVVHQARTTTVRHQQYSAGSFVSALREPNAGPNESLSNGPNSVLLSSIGVAVLGPDPANRQGPQSSYRSSALVKVQGSSAAVGPNPSNYCGPQAANYVGPCLAVPKTIHCTV